MYQEFQMNPFILTSEGVNKSIQNKIEHTLHIQEIYYLWRLILSPAYLHKSQTHKTADPWIIPLESHVISSNPSPASPFEQKRNILPVQFLGNPA